MARRRTAVGNDPADRGDLSAVTVNAREKRKRAKKGQGGRAEWACPRARAAFFCARASKRQRPRLIWGEAART
jgi:hypothetical protein